MKKTPNSLVKSGQNDILTTTTIMILDKTINQEFHQSDNIKFTTREHHYKKQSNNKPTIRRKTPKKQLT